MAKMVFAMLSGCSSLREVSSIMLACEGKINHLGLNKLAEIYKQRWQIETLFKRLNKTFP